MPGWLAASLMIAAGFAVAFGIFLDSENPLLVAAGAGAIGFGFALVILSIAAARAKPGQSSSILPPAVIRLPLLTAVLALYPLIMVTDRAVRLPRRRGSSTLLYDGDPAEATGLGGLLIIAIGVGLAIWTERRKSNSVRTSMVLSFVVALGILAYAIVRVIRFHGN
jgi:hypothetical protein